LKYESKIIDAYLPRERIIINRVLRSFFIVSAIMKIEFFKLVSVGERTTSNVYVLFRVLVYPEHDGLSRVVQRSAHLENKVMVVLRNYMC